MQKMSQLRQDFLEFYRQRGHQVIPPGALIPENDASTLFTSSGMQPLLPYFLGQPHPQGRRVADCQPCLRSVDIEEVGDNRHTTFFEMLGNWSFGDYFKREQLTQVFEFFTQVAGLSPNRLYVTIFAGDKQLGLPRDEESLAIWQEIFASVGIEARLDERIFAYPSAKNWWSRSGTPEQMPSGEPGGGDSEIFYDFGQDLSLHEQSPWAKQPCHPNCDCGRFIEIGNSVFMQYLKQADGSFVDLPEKNVDYGGGLERLVMAVENTPDLFAGSVFAGSRACLEMLSDKRYDQLGKQDKRAWRIVMDHVRAAVMLLSNGVRPSNKEQGYVLRRLLRRSMLEAHQAHLPEAAMTELVEPIVECYRETYPELKTQEEAIRSAIELEREKFSASLAKGLREIAKMDKITGEKAFFLYESYGFPLEMTEGIARERGEQVDRQAWQEAKKKHQQLSKTASSGKFRGGLADHSQQTVRFHTATHLLLAALQQLIDPQIYQKGSNITGERARFDFHFNRALTSDELAQVEAQVNAWIDQDLPVSKQLLAKDEALQLVGGSVFADRYPDEVSVYQIGDASQEICVGPHVERTGEIGRVRLAKQQSAGSGVRRLYLYFV